MAESSVPSPKSSPDLIRLSRAMSFLLQLVEEKIRSNANRPEATAVSLISFTPR